MSNTMSQLGRVGWDEWKSIADLSTNPTINKWKVNARQAHARLGRQNNEVCDISHSKRRRMWRDSSRAGAKGVWYRREINFTNATRTRHERIGQTSMYGKVLTRFYPDTIAAQGSPSAHQCNDK